MGIFKIKKTAWPLGLVMGIVLALSSTVHADTIKWQPYDAGISKAKKEGKKIFLHFYADWCQYCHTMKKKTFTDTGIVNYLNTNFVSIKVNSDKSRAVALKYRVRGLPSNWFLAEDGEKIGNRPGYIQAGDLMTFLKFIHTNSYKKMSLGAFKGAAAN
jgi:thioredoxin-related protein